MRVILAIDGGGTRTRCDAIDEQGRRLATGESGPSNHLQVASEVAAESLRRAIEETVARAGLRRGDIACVSAGLAGVDFDGAGREDAAAILAGIGYPGAVVDSDMAIAHRGALNGEAGIMALAGTGAVFLGLDAAGHTLKAGGWGPVFGDEGSGYWIAAEALRAAAQARDGRGAPTALVAALPRALGVADFGGVTNRIYREGARAGEVAALAPAVAGAAAGGDEVAAAILRRAGEFLAVGAIALARRMGWSGAAFPVSFQGAVLRNCAPVRQAFAECVAAALPSARLHPPRFEPVMGAFLLGCAAAGIARPALEGE